MMHNYKVKKEQIYTRKTFWASIKPFRIEILLIWLRYRETTDYIWDGSSYLNFILILMLCPFVF